MSTPTFQIGDIVQLKSGGPKMTVKASGQSGNKCYCQWFAGSKLEQGEFVYDTIVKYQEEKKKD